MASPQASPMDLGSAIIESTGHLLPHPTLPTPELCQSICKILLAGFHQTFTVDPGTLWMYFGLRLKQPRAQQVQQATCLLLSCRAFMAHVVNVEPRIRPVLVARVMLCAPEEDAYKFLVNNLPCPAHAIGEAFRFAMDPVMVQHAQGTSVSIMKRVVSFLKTEQVRGKKRLTDHFNMVEAGLKSPLVRTAMGMVIVDHVLEEPGLDVVLEALPVAGAVDRISQEFGYWAGLERK